jgi:ABC-2 family transporter protein
MIWLTWRQHRRQFLFAIAGLAVLAALMVPTGRQMHRAYVDTGLADCLAKLGRSEYIPLGRNTDCHSQMDLFNARFAPLTLLGILFVFLPLLVGLFFGAPLVAREVEHGTHRLVWTQGVSRLRWALVKFGLVGAAVLVLATAYALALGWWYEPLNHANGGRFFWLYFDVQGIVPVAYTLFAVALGVFAGTVWRKVLPAMAVTLVGFLGVRIAVAALARPRFLPAHLRTFPVADTVNQPNPALEDWIIDEGIYNGAGKRISAGGRAYCGPPLPSAAPSRAPGALPGGDPCSEFGVGAYNAQTYQPGDRFWLFQYIEAGLFIALAALLLVLAVRQVRRRIS